MPNSLLRSYTRNLNKSLRKITKNFESETRKNLRNLFLSKPLVAHQQYLPRHVVQSERNPCPPPFGSEYYRYVMHEIGMVNGKRLFFEMINEEMPSVNLMEEKRGTKTSPPTVIYCEQTEALARGVINLLDRLVLERRDRSINVPEGFYVFEFTTQESCGHYTRKPRVVTVEPFRAKNLKQAIEFFMRWPNGSSYKDLSKFRVCTKTGWTELKSSLKYPSSPKWSAGLDDYIVSPQE